MTKGLYFLGCSPFCIIKYTPTTWLFEMIILFLQAHTYTVFKLSYGDEQLETSMKKNHFPESKVCRTMKKLASAVSFMYRDLKAKVCTASVSFKWLRHL